MAAHDPVQNAHVQILLHAVQELEHREKQYDGREHLDVYTSNSDTEPALCRVLTFVATSKNVNWLGPASMEAIAQQIAASTGPSGPNHDYLDQLAKALWKVSLMLGQCDHNAVPSDDIAAIYGNLEVGVVLQPFICMTQNLLLHACSQDTHLGPRCAVMCCQTFLQKPNKMTLQP